MYTPVKCPDKNIQRLIDELPKIRNKEAKKAWVDALLSGEYKQSRQYLKKSDRRAFCCLGVATDVALNSGGVSGYWKNSGFVNSYGYGYEDGALPHDVKLWLNIFEEDPKVYYKGILIHLSVLNDVFKLDFEMIAGLIINQL